MRHLVLPITLLLPLVAAAAPPQCSGEAVAQARRLLAFHVNNDPRASVDSVAVERAPVRNPANKQQKLAVLEVAGTVYKGRYQMRLIYFRTGHDCVLMGQEILEHASL